MTIRHKIEFITVIITFKETNISKLEYRTLSFIPIIVALSKRNADFALENIRKKIETKQEINELDLIFLPIANVISKSDSTNAAKKQLG